MAVVKITFDGSTVSALQDAEINHYFANGINGIFKLLGQCSYYLSNNYVYINSGYAQVYGRRVYIESGTKISISLDRSAYGTIILKFDLGNNEVTLTKKESTGSYPALTQEDLFNGGLIYELPLCQYTKTTSSITLNEDFAPTYIEQALGVALEARDKANSLALKTKSVGYDFWDTGAGSLVKSKYIDLSSLPQDAIIIFNLYYGDYFAYGGPTYYVGTYTIHGFYLGIHNIIIPYFDSEGKTLGTAKITFPEYTTRRAHIQFSSDDHPDYIEVRAMFVS